MCVHVGDSSRRSEEIVKILNCAFNAIIIVAIVIIVVVVVIIIIIIIIIGISIFSPRLGEVGADAHISPT